MKEQWWRWAAGLVAVILAFQVWTLRRDQGRHLYNISHEMRQFHDRIALLQQQIDAARPETAPAWLTLPDIAVTPTGCGTGQARIAWGLLQFEEGETARLQYRQGDDAVWRDAETEPRGGQTYVASVPIDTPGIHWNVWVDHHARRAAGMQPRHVYWPPAEEQHRAGYPAMPAYQYQIITNTRSTGGQTLRLPDGLVTAAALTVTVAEGGRYEAVVQAQRHADPCLLISQVAARAGAVTYPLTRGEERWSGAWQLDQPLEQLDLVVRYGEREVVIPVDLSAR